MAEFSEILKDLMAKRNMSQPDLADILGVSRVSISKYQNGKALPDYDGLLKIADLFNVTTDYLLGREHAEKHYVDPTKIDEDQEQFFNQLKALILSSGEKLTKQELDHIAEFSSFVVNRDRKK